MLTPSPIQAPGGPVYPGYDPLAAHFLSGGQMGYMPNAQFLTPAEYGAFRQTPDIAPFTSTYQAPSLWQSYLQANRGNPLGGLGMQPGGLPYMANVYTPGVNPLIQQTMAARRTMDAGTGFMAGAGNVGMQTAMGALGGMAGGAAFGLPGMMLGGMMGYAGTPDVFAGVADRTRQMRAIQQTTMPKIFAGPDVSRTMGRGLTAGAARGLDEDIRQFAVEDMMFNEADYRDMLKMGTQAGLFDYSGSAEQIKNNLKAQMKNVRMLKDVLEIGTSEEAVGILKWAQQMGAGPGAQSAMLGIQNMAGRMTGLAPQDLLETYGRQGALTYSQMGMTAYQGAAAGMAAAGGVELMRRTGMVTAGEVARAGGVSGMVQGITETGARGMQGLSDFFLPGLAREGFGGIDPTKMAQFIANPLDMTKSMAESGGRVATFKTMGSYMANKGNLMQEFMDIAGPQASGAVLIKIAEDMSKKFLPEGEPVTKEGLLSSLIALQPDADPEILKTMVNMYTSEGSREALIQQTQQSIREIGSAERAESELTYGIRGRMTRSLRRVGYNVVGRPMSGITDWLTADDEYKESVKAGAFTPGAGFGAMGRVDTGDIKASIFATDELQTGAERLYRAANNATNLTSEGRKDAIDALRATLSEAGVGVEFDNATLASISAEVFEKYGEINRGGVREVLERLGVPEDKMRAVVDAVIANSTALQGVLIGVDEDAGGRAGFTADKMRDRRKKITSELVQDELKEVSKRMRPLVASDKDARELMGYADKFDVYTGMVGLAEAFEAADTDRGDRLRSDLRTEFGLSAEDMELIFAETSPEDQMRKLGEIKGIKGERLEKLIGIAKRTSEAQTLFGVKDFTSKAGAGISEAALQAAKDEQTYEKTLAAEERTESEAMAGAKASQALLKSLPTFLEEAHATNGELNATMKSINITLNKINEELLR